MGGNGGWGSYPAYLVPVTGVPAHHLHQGGAVALDDGQVLPLQLGEAVLWGGQALPHGLPWWRERER